MTTPCKQRTGRRLTGAAGGVPAIASRTKPALIAIVGGSGSGKTWLSQKLKQALSPHAASLSLDDFYLDRSHLNPERRALLNFDHPRAIDWPALRRVLYDLLAGRNVGVPSYDFKTHCRRRGEKVMRPKPIILIDGLWLLRPAFIRRLFSLTIFLECSCAKRLRRRLVRDLASRGRTRASIISQFRESVEPMHARFVAPQTHLADIVLERDCTRRDLRTLVTACREAARL